MTLHRSIGFGGGYMRRVVLIGLSLVCAACAHRASYAPKALTPSAHAAARDEVRGYAKTYCGTCHQSSLPTAKPAALAIYNLDRDDWASMLTDERLRNGFPRRLNAQLDDAGRSQLRAFIEAELALRNAP
jgi:hypothetical protein